MPRRALPLVLFVAVFAAVPWAGAAPDGPGADEAALTTRANSERAGRSIVELAVRDDLVAVARRHAAEMARRGRVGHYGNLPAEVSGWSALGENVGMGASADEVHAMFMSSSTHRGEILDARYLDVGVGVVWSGGRMWVSEVFRAPSGAPAPPSPPPPPPPPRTTQQRASRDGTRTAVAAVAAAPVAPPAPAPPPPPPPPPAPTTTVPRPVDDFRDEDVRARRRSTPAVALAAAPIGHDDATGDGDADVEMLLVLAGTIAAAGAVAVAFDRRTSA